MTQQEHQDGAQPLSFHEKIQFLANKILTVLEPGRDIPVMDSGEPLDKNAQVKDRAGRMRDLEQAYDLLDPVLKAINAEYDAIRKKVIPDLMQELEIRTVTYDGIGRIQLAGDVYASIPADQQEAAFQWLREHNYGTLIKESVHSATLKAWAKEGLEQGRELPEGVFKVEPYTRASIVKVKGSKKAA